MERTGDTVALDHTIAQVAPQMRAEGVDYIELLAVLTLEHHQFGAKGLDLVWLAVTEPLGQAQAVPATGETLDLLTDNDASLFFHFFHAIHGVLH
ncbi:hypothetical protein D9M69_620130 [compost metagenome]